MRKKKSYDLERRRSSSEKDEETEEGEERGGGGGQGGGGGGGRVKGWARGATTGRLDRRMDGRDGKTDRTGDRSLRAAHARGMRRLWSSRYNKYRIGSDRQARPNEDQLIGHGNGGKEIGRWIKRRYGVEDGQTHVEATFSGKVRMNRWTNRRTTMPSVVTTSS